jgi:carbamoyltransferase
MIILGISAYYHDSAVALVRDGEIVAAAQEERFSRKKNDARFPVQSLRWCLAHAGIRGQDIDHVAFYDKPFLKFERLLETYMAFAPRGFSSFRTAMPVWIGEKVFQKDLLRRELQDIDAALAEPNKLLFAEHHFSHAASAFFPSPFEEAAVLTVDGVGEWATTTAGIGRGADLAITKEIHFPHSLGLLYAAFTYYTGFKVNSDEYKVMGLAPYGEAKYAQTILNHLIDLKPDGSFRLNLDYFDYCTGLTMTNGRFDALFGGPPRKSGEPIAPRHMDLAASIQAVLDEAMLRLRARWHKRADHPICVLPAVLLSIASPTARSCAMADFAMSGSSRLQVMLVVRSVPHWRGIICTKVNRAGSITAPMRCRAPTSALPSRQRRFGQRSTSRVPFIASSMTMNCFGR